MRTLLKYMKNLYGKMWLSFAIRIIATAGEIFIPFLLSYMLKNVITREVKDIIFFGTLMILCGVVTCIFTIYANRLVARISCTYIENMRKDLFYKVMHLSARQTDEFTIPSLETRITSDTLDVYEFMNMILRTGLQAPLLLICCIVITVIMDAKLSVVMTVLLPINLFIILFIRKNSLPIYRAIQKATDKMTGVAREDVHGIRVIKALSNEEKEQERYNVVNKLLSKTNFSAIFVIGTAGPVMNVFLNLGSAAVIFLGAIFVSKGTSSPETIIAFMQYFVMISNAIVQVTNMFVRYTTSSVSAKRILEIFHSEEDLKIEEKSKYPNIKTKDRIVFDNVAFSYNGRRNNIENISFALRKGGHLGIIGATGSGKSTIVKLLLRFYDADSGGIYIDGENIKTIEKKKLFSGFGTCLQNGFIYADTVEENIKFGRDISHEDVVKAAKIAQAHEFISDFTEGYNRRLASRGTNISGGQRQRILIARAIAGNPEILILDDSSSALDYKTDAMLRVALAENLKDTTVITVAQRISTVKNCDFIIVIDGGKIIGQGTHEELLRDCIEYKEISDSQMGGAFVD